MCCLFSQYTGRPVQPIGPAGQSPLIPAAPLELETAGGFPRKFEENMGSCGEMVPSPFMAENPQFAGGPFVGEEEKPLAMDLAMSCMDELLKMCRSGEPLWVRGNNGREMMNGDEYSRLFPWPLGVNKPPSSDIRMEATRASAVVIMNSITLVDAFLEAVYIFPTRARIFLHTTL